LVEAGHLLGFVGGRDERGAELARWLVSAAARQSRSHVDLALDAAVQALKAGYLTSMSRSRSSQVDNPGRVTGDVVEDLREGSERTRR
jgi:hypothetical protein